MTLDMRRLLLATTLLLAALALAAADGQIDRALSRALSAPGDGGWGFIEQGLTANEAYQRALELLRSTLASPPPSSASTSSGSSSSSKGSTSASRRSPKAKKPSILSTLHWDALTSWSPIGTVLRLVWRARRYLEGDGPIRAATKRSGWESAGGSGALGRESEGQDEAWDGWQGSKPLQLWPEWEGYDAVVEGPFLSSTPGVQLTAPSASVSDRIIAAAGSQALQILPSPVVQPFQSRTLKRTKAETAKMRAADARREEAIALLTWAAGFEPTPKSQRGEVTSGGTDWASKANSASISPHEQLELLNTSNFTEAAKSAAAKVHADALWVLGAHSLIGTHGLAPNRERARACFTKLSLATGNASAHARLGWLEGGAWGEGANEVHPDGQAPQAKALVHYSLAALGGDPSAQMTLGYRHHAGIGVPQHCPLALRWYERAATQAYERFLAGPPGGLTLPYTKLRLSDAAGGVFGPGASAASTGIAAHRPAVQAALHSFPGTGDPASDPRRLEDLVEFYTYHADRGNAGFALRLARIFYGGSVWGSGESAGRVRRDYRKAKEYALRITADVWPTDSAVVKRGGPTGQIAAKGQRGEDIVLKADAERMLLASSAAVLVGRMFLRGEGVKQDFGRAWVWFMRAADQGDSEAYNYIGLMFRDGLGMPQNARKAAEYFQAAATQRPPSAGGAVNLGKLHMDLGDLKQAVYFLEYGAKLGDPFEAFYLLARINMRLARGKNPSGPDMGIGTPGSVSYERCKNAVAGFKQAAERADWFEPLFYRGERAWKRGDRQRALDAWAMAGERGYEAAQNNVAWILDRDKRRLRLPAFDAPEDNSTDRTALIHWTRSAAQGNVDALVKMGDYYFHGFGIRSAASAASSTASSAPQPSAHASTAQPALERAAACYAAAADRQVSALAYWNMGWMYESGLGVPRQDFHLAKRYYDMASTVNPAEAYLPVMLSLVRLHVRALWATLFHADSSAISLFASYTSRTNEGSAAYTEAEERAIREGGGQLDFGGGQAKGGGGQKKQGASAPKPHLRANEAGLGGGGGGDPNLPETYEMLADEEGRGGGGGGQLDANIEGAMLVIGLAALAWLIYMRQGVQMRIERERREALGAAAAGAAAQGGGEQGNDNDRQAGDEETRDRRVPGQNAGAPQPQNPFPWPPTDANAYAPVL